jgi:hypothetical protein
MSMSVRHERDRVFGTYRVFGFTSWEPWSRSDSVFGTDKVAYMARERIDRLPARSSSPDAIKRLGSIVLGVDFPGYALRLIAY